MSPYSSAACRIKRSGFSRIVTNPKPLHVSLQKTLIEESFARGRRGVRAGQPNGRLHLYHIYQSPGRRPCCGLGSLWTVERQIERFRPHSLDRLNDGLTG